jgi:hypothetical protein
MRRPGTSGGEGSLERDDAISSVNETPERARNAGMSGQPGRTAFGDRMGGAPVTSRRITEEGQTLEREKPRRGSTHDER